MITQASGRLTRWTDADPQWNEKLRVIYDYADRDSVSASQCWHDSMENGMIIPCRHHAYQKLGYKTETLNPDSKRRRKRVGGAGMGVEVQLTPAQVQATFDAMGFGGGGPSHS
jgi:hypothetical protein